MKGRSKEDGCGVRVGSSSKFLGPSLFPLPHFAFSASRAMLKVGPEQV